MARKIIDLKGRRFGRLVVIDSAPKKKKDNHARWKCICDCGNIKIVSGANLKNGNTKSCGCLSKEHGRNLALNREIDLVGKKFGKLTVIEKAYNKNNKNYWKCKCECGNEKIIRGDNLTRELTKSCGCLQESYGVFKIKELLKDIPYITEYRFKDCKDKEMLPFDFFVNDSYIIEFDGKQHFKENQRNGWFDFKVTHKHDLIKNKYCFDNNIPLIRIPYNVTFSIEDLNINTTRFLLTKENEEIYYQERMGNNA